MSTESPNNCLDVIAQPLNEIVLECKPETTIDKRSKVYVTNLNEFTNHIANNVYSTPFLKKNAPQVIQLNCYRQQDFEQVTLIGSGGFSTVYSGTHRLDRLKYALKVLHKSHSRSALERGKKEVALLSRLNHPNIVRYYTCWIEPDLWSRPEINQQLTVPIGSINLLPPMLDGSRDRRNSDSSNLFTSPKSSEIITSVSTSTNSASGYLSDLEENQSSDYKETDCDLPLAIPVEPSKISPEFSEPLTPSLFIQMELCQYSLQEWLNYRNAYFFQSDNPHSIESARLEFEQPPDGSVNLDARQKLVQSTPWCRLNCAPIRWLFDQTACGLQYLHQHGFLHRDLKPANIFIQAPPLDRILQTPCIPTKCTRNSPGCSTDNSQYDKMVCFHTLTVKIGDFGLSTLLTYCDNALSNYFPAAKAILPASAPSSGETDLVPSSFLTGNLGTVLYAAPEVIHGTKRRIIYDYKADIYSLAVVMFQLLFPCITESELVFHLLHFQQKQVKSLSPPPDSLPEELLLIWPFESKLLIRMLNSNPKSRPSARELLECLSYNSEVLELSHNRQHNRFSCEVGSQYALTDYLIRRNQELEKEVSFLRSDKCKTKNKTVP